MAKERRRAPGQNRRESTWSAGLTPFQERIFNILALLIAITLLSAWIFTYIQIRQTPPQYRAQEFGEPEIEDPHIVEEGRDPLPIERVERREIPSIARELTRSMFDVNELNLAFLNEAIVQITEPLGGYSGDLRVLLKMPGDPSGELAADDLSISYHDMAGNRTNATPGRVPTEPGIYTVRLQKGSTATPIENFHVIVQVPFKNKQNGRIGNYRLGTWPFEKGGKPKSPRYADPEGFIEVSREATRIPVSTHFTLGDFLTKGQGDVWPKYLVLDPRLLDKLELIIDGLQARGVAVRNVAIMSGFRHPAYNTGGGNTAGRASLSRHQYGDASDIFVDNDENNWSDDITGDGKLTLRDAELIRDLADSIERRYPALVGGVGIYPACCGHGPMTHVDVRGYRARWYY